MDQTVCGLCTGFDTKQRLLMFALGPEFTKNKRKSFEITDFLSSSTLLNQNEGFKTFLQSFLFPWIYEFLVKAMYIRDQVGN